MNVARAMRQGVIALLLLGFLVPAGLPALGASATDPAIAKASRGGPPLATDGPTGFQTAVEPDLVSLIVDLETDGDAAWTVSYLVRLDSQNETEAFRSLMADIRNNSSAYVDRFAQRMNATVASAEDATGRQMTAGQFSVSAEIRQLPQRYGVLTYRFIWTGFAKVSGDTITAGDALAGLYLDGDTSLQIEAPPGYVITSVQPEPSSRRTGTVVWRGPLDFSSGEPSVTVKPADTPTPTQTPTSTPPSTTPATTSTPTEDGTGPGVTTTTPPPASGAGFWPFVGGGFVLLVLIGVGYWYWRSGEEPGPAPPDEGTPESTSDEPPDELLSNEERVIQYLESQGGRAKQQEIVEALDWTEAKTSQVLSEMQEDETVEKFRIGRENVVKLPEAEDEFP
ncbi:MAG: hypothetical protein ABEI31_02555 [Halodesulfurarchaeum sp.]